MEEQGIGHVVTLKGSVFLVISHDELGDIQSRLSVVIPWAKAPELAPSFSKVNTSSFASKFNLIIEVLQIMWLLVF